MSAEDERERVSIDGKKGEKQRRTFGTHFPCGLRLGANTVEDAGKLRRQPVPEPFLLLQRPVLAAPNDACNEGLVSGTFMRGEDG
jgi:hypothetical protein